MSYFNFISNHNTIDVRFGGLNNTFTKEALQKIRFDSELHLNAKKICQNLNEPYLKSGSKNINDQENFRRKIINPDMASCWLNACLHLILTALGHSNTELKTNFFSELGTSHH